jgi:hypothetical protein
MAKSKRSLAAKKMWAKRRKLKEGSEGSTIEPMAEVSVPISNSVPSNPNTNLTIGEAVTLLRAGHRVSRYGWNGKGMFLELQAPDTYSKMTLPYVYMKTADGNLVPWLCSQTDLLARDWMIVI